MWAFLFGIIKGIFGEAIAKIFGRDRESKLEKENIGLRKRVTRATSETVKAENEAGYKAGVEKRTKERINAKSANERIDNTSHRYRKP